MYDNWVNHVSLGWETLKLCYPGGSFSGMEYRVWKCFEQIIFKKKNLIFLHRIYNKALYKFILLFDCLRKSSPFLKLVRIMYLLLSDLPTYILFSQQTYTIV